MDGDGSHRRRPSPSLALSCAAATAFLLLVSAAAALALYLVFRPRRPEIAVDAVRIPTFAASNGTVSFTFSQYAAVRNPNRASSFVHYDSSLQIVYAGSQVGFMFIPAGSIDAGRTQYMEATFSVRSFPLAPPEIASAVAAPAEGVVEVVSKMRMRGRVRVMRWFNHRVVSVVGCRVAVSAVDGSVLGFHCLS
ncbi:hypothetical protein QJS10_CPB12g00842 [Acorus calamus]|uniref:Late embryogenesis abundant protein LEA-2 subgroup domain-containing protein n=1 Tax=Acorus calamus TaxID=4465 RepID=A0AAV9DLS6_ACOCL|nr:hypothetical protein QJS10_CPB12g00842 [Acorus calamus]